MKKTSADQERQHISGRLSTRRPWWRYPIIWMLVGTLGIILVGTLGVALEDTLFRPLAGQADGVASLLVTLTAGIAAILVYRLTMKYLAHRSSPELSRKRAGMEAGMGILTGAIFIAVSTMVIAAAGGYSFQWASSADMGSVLITSVTSALSAAMIEELVFRGLMLQAIHKMAGSWAALAVTSIFFGAAHLGNAGATLWSAFAITVEAGILLGAAFLWRRNLWYVMGLHFAWNTLESLLGIPVSGHPPAGLFTVEVNGAAILTGGDFGLEGSVVPVVVSLLIAIPMLIGAARNRKALEKV
ncbi:type II CAAX endopeptidase family protein [Paenibacillus sp. YPG26]|uniref:CPBP family intramembrane glutamic endopeptidase n=1 Tax=Paenibacillus sp. YPG26 TaxID=2878915 RepID=UPI00203A58A8|nr:type II CAAX endopeptidase family protein [Paenibacillus sp. YPG26]USB33211.1 CPBP family intramembrane metalloprotease [Paenibacillus sp. YPG26]